MKLFFRLLLLTGCLLFAQSGFSQLNPIKRFDYKLLEGKKLLIPTYTASKSYIKRMTRRGKLEKVDAAKAEAADYNALWKEAMAESSYDATDYEIKAFNAKNLIKSKNKQAIMLEYYSNGINDVAYLTVTAPKRRVIASTIINGINFRDKNDVRLMINMLNESLNTSSELEGEGDKSYKAMRNKYKQGVVDFYDDIKDKTFLVPKSEHKKPKKAAERNADLKTALKSWKLSGYEMTTYDEIDKKRVEGDTDSYYWRDFPIYTQNVLITYHYNYILSTDGDDILFAFLGKKRLKPATLEAIQKKITAKAEKYKEQLAK